MLLQDEENMTINYSEKLILCDSRNIHPSVKFITVYICIQNEYDDKYIYNMNESEHCM